MTENSDSSIPCAATSAPWVSSTDPFLALDPGNTLTAFVLYDPVTKLPTARGKVPNEEIYPIIEANRVKVVCEFPYPRGQSVAWQTLETCEVAGMFRRHCNVLGISFTKMNRQDIKVHLCRKGNAKDSHVRAALIVRYGGDAAIQGGKCPTCNGRKGDGRGSKRIPCAACEGTGRAKPGPLHGISADVWQALAVAVTYQECGPSKSAALLQVERKERNSLKKENALAKIPILEATYLELSHLTCGTEKQIKARDKRLASVAKQLKKLKEKYLPDGTLHPASN